MSAIGSDFVRLSPAHFILSLVQEPCNIVEISRNDLVVCLILSSQRDENRFLANYNWLHKSSESLGEMVGKRCGNAVSQLCKKGVSIEILIIRITSDRINLLTYLY